MSKKETVLVTGGAGYIGSHTVKQLLKKNYEVVVFDNLVSGHEEFVLAEQFVEGDIGDRELLDETFRNYEPDAVMHFAAHCRVGESVRDPAKYYENNVVKALTLLNTVKDFEIDKLIFSSSAAIYGDPQEIPIKEEAPKEPENPYGRTKLIFERILEDYSRSYPLSACSLRYFNAAGTDPEGELGEIHDPETHLIPVVLEAAAGERDYIEIFGTNYDTPDGTAIRDFIHVDDLARAHISALETLGGESENYLAYNLGTGRGHSVKEVIETCKEVTEVDIPVREGERRPGDPPKLVAAPQKGFRELNWEPEIEDLTPIVETSWNWIKKRYNIN
ncbi:UDP-glucose 4-epimerase GalE [Candidatus Bipolaricaulota bacterium]|nr:UDP-glucose 4-epimerase GalE [Candidatus Bipolaricaulota bacterium]